MAVLQPSGPISYLTPADLPVYAFSVAGQIDPASAAALIQRASAQINAYYGRTAEIVQIAQEISEINDDNMGHVAYGPVQVTSGGFLDASQGDLLDVRYSETLYPYASMFGAPQWQPVTDFTTIDVNPRTGRFWLPPGLYPVPYNEMRVTYRAGFCPVGGPYPEWLKQGCGRLIENMINRSGSVQVQKMQLADQQSVQFFDRSMFDEDIKGWLSPLTPRMWR